MCTNKYRCKMGHVARLYYLEVVGDFICQNIVVILG